MTSRRRTRISRAQRQRQEEEHLRDCCPCAETSHKTTIPIHRNILSLLRRTLSGFGIAAFVIILVSATPTLAAGPEETSFLARSDAALARMMAAMKITPSNDVDRDFVTMMVPHHRGAIDMAQAELSYGHNEALRRLAQEIIVTQQDEITSLPLALASVAPYPLARSEETSFLASSDAAMARMMAAMKIKPANDVDRDFVAMMVPHHRGAIDMARAELSYGHNEPLRRLVQEIIVTQQDEITALRLALGEPFPPSEPSSNQLFPTSMLQLMPYHSKSVQYVYATGAPV